MDACAANVELNKALVEKDDKEGEEEGTGVTAAMAGDEEDDEPVPCTVFDGVAAEEESVREEEERRLLVVLVHGFLGTTADFAAFQKLLEELPNVEVMVSSRNAALSSNAGVAAGGRVLAREIADHLLGLHFPGADTRTVAQEYSEQPLLQLESIRDTILPHVRGSPPLALVTVGHSLGGLYIRYAVGLLYETGYLSGPNRLLSPLSYVSVASPHLGSRRPKVGMKSRFIQATLESASMMGSRTICDLLMRDGPHPLVVTMSEPDSCFMKGLALFRTRTAVSTTHYDQIVPFASAAIMAENPYTPVPHSNRFFVIDSSGFGEAHEAVIWGFKAHSHHHSTPNLSTSTSSTTSCNGISPSTPNLRMNSEEEPAKALWQEDEVTQGKKEETDEEKDVEEEEEDAIEGLVVDSEGQLEYRPEALANLQCLEWRRLHVQFSSATRLQRWMSHEAPLAKKKGPVVSHVLNIDTNSGKDFLTLLLEIVRLDSFAF